VEKIKLQPCDNCGRKHWGYYERTGGPWDPPEYDFVWTTPNGDRKKLEFGELACDRRK